MTALQNKSLTNSNVVNGVEWIDEDSVDYQKILMFNDPTKPLMKTSPGEKIDCYVDEAYIYETKSNGFIVGLIPRIQFAVNFIKYPQLAGEYIINEISATDASNRPFRYKVDHRQRVPLSFLNHIIDLNRPDILDPQTIFENELGFKNVCQIWTDRTWLPVKINDAIQQLPDGASDMLDDRVVDVILSNPGYKRALKTWRDENWIDDKKAKEYAISGKPVKTVDDELSFAIEINQHK